MEDPSAHNQPSAHNNPGSMDQSARDQPDSREYPYVRRRVHFRWTPELRNQFVEAVNSLGGAQKASPGDILELMGNVDNLTKTIVASQLQKYRKRAGGQTRLRNLQENSTYTAGPLEESRLAYSLENTLNRLRNSNNATSYTINSGGANEVDATFVFYLDQ